MPFTATYTENLIGLDSAYSKSQTFTAGAKLAINEIIPSGATNQLVNFEFGINSGILLAMSINTIYPITIKANDPNTPTNTFIFNNTNTRIFTDITGQDVDDLDQPIQSITGLYVDNTGVISGTLIINSLYDPTP